MKAAEYVQRFRDAMKNPPKVSTIYDGVPANEDAPADRTDVLVLICRDLTREAKEIMTARKAQCPDALGAVMREQVEKSRAIARRLADEGVPEGFYMKFLEIEFPDLKSL